MAVPFTKLPPPVPEPVTVRFDTTGRPTVEQTLYERALRQWMINLVKGLGTMQAVTDASALPTTNPHVVGEVYSNAGVLTVSAG